MTDLIGYFATAGILFGNAYVIKKNVLGMWLMLFGNICWLAVACMTDLTSLIVASFLFMSVNIYGIIKWSKTKLPKMKSQSDFPLINFGVPEDPPEDAEAIAARVKYFAIRKSERQYLRDRKHWHEFNPWDLKCRWCGKSDIDYENEKGLGTDDRRICEGNEKRLEVRLELIKRFTKYYGGYSHPQFVVLFKATPTQDLSYEFKKCRLDVEQFGGLFRADLSSGVDNFDNRASEDEVDRLTREEYYD